MVGLDGFEGARGSTQDLWPRTAAPASFGSDDALDIDIGKHDWLRVSEMSQTTVSQHRMCGGPRSSPLGFRTLLLLLPLLPLLILRHTFPLLWLRLRTFILEIGRRHRRILLGSCCFCGRQQNSLGCGGRMVWGKRLLRTRCLLGRRRLRSCLRARTRGSTARAFRSSRWLRCTNSSSPFCAAAG